ncbi:MAG: 16S rRNA (guanine(966)-N(2))-methyltransferase RsmD [Sphaerochaetaceae bacterium]|jgi:16S rRNA (guanine966-N2)-methyltransferase|nr:16S rRNA (guanine(966)-N(2))-methyltransferase RsmD [Sphaerochaetaceae bacterium]MDD3163219.1 16S rRNA (guanine(966)-N(2))-methyltransferase RsmD [Sphaerochaetaceae bacterium]MDD4006702.1 16S rRNA (guanine(966)-N(2))-methyltransferase RsmD [Sphaerochaetaceae bacterium]MDD4396349.1 16S rRNA (guanine(966)-N(2))-methyltransferase RsmD [Sphaerochaetaceae bacterium]
MRITGGKYRGRNVLCPPGVIRPAMDMMRESLFDILGPLYSQSFLDLFTGSGCVGIEAASRGAEPVHIVEKDKAKKETIEKNISFVDTDIRLFMADVFRFIPTAKMQYDIVYADPPFPMGGKLRLLQAADRKGIVKPGGLFIIHYPSEERSVWPETVGSFTFTDERKYGRSMLRFYRRAEENDEH